MHGFGFAAQGAGQALNFGQAAGDQCGAGVGTQLQAVGDPAGNGHDVLERAAHFHTGDVFAGVDPAAWAVQSSLYDVAGGGFVPRYRQRDRQALSHFQGEGRA